MTFTEFTTVEPLLRDLLCGGITHHTAVGAGLARKSGKLLGAGWHYLASDTLPRQPQDALVEPFVRDALIRLNPEISNIPLNLAGLLEKKGQRCDALAVVHAFLKQYPDSAADDEVEGLLARLQVGPACKRAAHR